MAKWWKISHRWNVEDRRSVVWTAGWIGVVWVLAILAVWYFGWTDQALQLLWTMQENQPTITQTSEQTAQFEWEDSYEVFSSTVLGSNNALWKKAFESNWLEYIPPRLVLFRWSTPSACGWANSQTWPHYCPTDMSIYLDETFFDELTKKFWAKWWDVAEAYVIAHEVWHHIQKLIWNLDKVFEIRKTQPELGNAASIKLELQADCLAWIWAQSVAKLWVLEKWEISEAIDAAEAVWDDRIQEAAYWESHPETWTHGSSADRKKWFSIWYEYADFNKCNTF